LTTVGLPDSAVRESRERVRTAIRNAGFAFPFDRITVKRPFSEAYPLGGILKVSTFG
jgi:hypothetical protein